MMSFGEQSAFERRLSQFARRYQIQIRVASQRQAVYENFNPMSAMDPQIYQREMYELTISERDIDHLMKVDNEWRDLTEAAKRIPAVKDAYEQLLTAYYLTRPQYDPIER